jgi:RecA-family ATPase
MTREYPGTFSERVDRKPRKGDGPNGARTEQPPPLVFTNMSNWDHEPVPEQEWTVFNRIPKRQCVLFSGEGGMGKSTEGLHLCAAHVLARDWLGSMPEPGPAIFVDAEDEQKVMHYRSAGITSHYQVRFADLIKGGLHLLSLFGQDAVMASVGRNGIVEPTPLYKQLFQAAGDIKPVTIAIAASANVYAGSEIDRSQVQQFVGLLTRIAIVANGSVVLISHPSQAGITNDSGISGSTQWHDSVRPLLSQGHQAGEWRAVGQRSTRDRLQEKQLRPRLRECRRPLSERSVPAGGGRRLARQAGAGAKGRGGLP